MAFELSPEAMRSPLRSLSITFGPGDRDLLLAKLRAVANEYRLANRVSSDPAEPGDVYVQLYRSDIKMIGRIPNGMDQLDLTVLRRLHRVPAAAVEHILGSIRKLVSEVPRARLEQTIFVRGDDMALEPRTGIAAVRSARLTHPDGAQDAIKQQLAQYADKYGFAVRFTQTTPDPKDLAVYLYSEILDITVDKAFSNQQMDVHAHRTGDRSRSEPAIDSIFGALRASIEQVPGVVFTPR